MDRMQVYNIIPDARILQNGGLNFRASTNR